MKKARDFTQVVASVVALAILALGLMTAFQAMSGRGAVVTTSTAEATSPPYPPPGTPPEPQATYPTPFIIELQPSQDLIFPSLTPFPTSTPQPTATRQPGPTATPFPTNPPASDASGIILYLLQDQPVIMALTVDGAGQKIGEATPLPLTLDFSPSLVAPSPNGRYLLLLRPAFPATIPYIYDTESAQMWQLFQDDLNGYIQGGFFGWHPNSRQVLFSSHHVALWLVTVETGETTTLAFVLGAVRGATLSPDGQEIVYVNLRPGSSYEAMWKVSAAGSDAQALFDLISGEVFGWSPDGTRVLYAGGPGINPDGTPIGTPVPGGPFSLWLMDPNGQNQRPLSRLSLSSWGFDPVWSPDSQWIALTDQDEDQEFGCYRTTPPPDPENCQFEGAAIYIENVVTGEVRRLATGIEPVWSPDGSRLAFLSIQSGATEIWTIKTDGTDLQQLTADGQTKNSRLSWSR